MAITTSDTTTKTLDDKLTAGDGLSKTVVNPAGDETLDLDIDISDTTIFKDARTGNEQITVTTQSSDGKIDDTFIRNRLLRTVTAGEDLTAGQAVFLGKGDTTGNVIFAGLG